MTLRRERSVARPRGQAGISLIEVLIGVMLSSLMILPVMGWSALALRAQRDVVTRNLSGASLGNLRTTFTRDVANSSGAWVDGKELAECESGRSGARTVLVLAAGDRRIAYVTVPSSSRAASSSAAAADAEQAAAQQAAAAKEADAKEADAKAAEAKEAEDEEADAKATDAAEAKDEERAKAAERRTAAERAKREEAAKAGAATAEDEQAAAEQAKKAEQVRAEEEAKRADEAKQADEAEAAAEQAEDSDGDGTVALVRVRCAEPGAAPTSSIDLIDDVVDGGTDATCMSTAELAKRTGSKNEVLLADASCRLVTLRVMSAALDRVALTAVRRAGGTVADQMSAPIAIATAKPTSGARKLSVAFDGSGSSDPLGEKLSYRWDFGDGGTGTGVSTTHDYTSVGAFTATLTVTTSSGRSSATTVAITVADNAPVAVIAAPATGTSVYRGQKVSFSSSGSGDPLDAAYGGTVVSYAWDFGDGSVSSEANPTKVFTGLSPAAGFVVTLVVTDDAGQKASARINVIVANRLPTVTLTASPTSGAAPLTVTYTAKVTDEPDLSPAPALTWSWDLGNGTTVTTSSPVTATYKSNGTFTAKVTVTDDSGASASATQQVTVGAAGPAAPVNLRKANSGEEQGLRFIEMAWDRRDGATKYEVQLSCVSCSEVVSGQESGTTLRIRGLSQPSKSYDARVRAMNSSGTWGDWSAAVRVTS